MQTIYNTILQRLKEIPEILLVDLDTGQVDDPAGNYVLPFPAVLIGFSGVEWQEIGSGIVTGDALVTVRVCFQIWEDVNSETPEAIYYDGIKRMEIVTQVFGRLQGLTGEDFNELQIRSTNNETRSNVMIFTETYVTHLRRNQARRLTEAVPISLQLKTSKAIRQAEKKKGYSFE